MTYLMTKIDIKLHTRTLTGAGINACERLLQPFVEPPRHHMKKTSEWYVAGDEVDYRVHVNGLCMLTEALRDAVYELITSVPEVRVELARGHARVQDTLVPHLRTEKERASYRLRLWEVLQDEAFDVVLNGMPAPVEDGAVPVAAG